MRTQSSLRRVFVAAVAAGSFWAVHVDAAAITQGNLVVTRVGDGAAALSNNATVVNVIEFTTAGASVQNIAMPTATGGGANAYSASGTQTEQQITLSRNGQYLTLGGYNATPGTATPANTASSTINRVIGVIDVASGAVDTSRLLNDTGTGSNNNFRSVTSVDGTQFWMTTATAGTRYVTSGPTTTGLTTLNSRVANIFDNGSGNQLYLSSGSGTNTTRGVNTVGTGLPTSGSPAISRLPGMTDAVSASSWDFLFADANTLYVVDDGSSASTGGLQKWKFDGANWAQAYRIATDGTVNFGLRSLAGSPDGLGNITLFATTNESTGTRLVKLTDSIAAVSAPGLVFTSIATAPANTAFRGVEFIPVPEPTSFSLILLGAAGLAARRRRVL